MVVGGDERTIAGIDICIFQPFDTRCHVSSMSSVRLFSSNPLTWSNAFFLYMLSGPLVTYIASRNPRSFLVNAMILYSIAWVLVRKFFGLLTKTLDVTPPVFVSLKNPIIWLMAFLFGIESASLNPINSVFTYFTPKFFAPAAFPVFFGVLRAMTLGYFLAYCFIMLYELSVLQSSTIISFFRPL